MIDSQCAEVEHCILNSSNGPVLGNRVHHLGWFRSDNPVAHGGSARMQLFAAQTGQYEAPQGFGRIRVSRSGRSRRRRMHPSGPKLVWALRLRYDEGFDRCLRPCAEAFRALRRFRKSLWKILPQCRGFFHTSR